MISPRTNSATYLPNIFGVFITSIPFDSAASMSIWSVPEPHLTIYFNFVAVFITSLSIIMGYNIPTNIIPLLLFTSLFTGLLTGLFNTWC